MDFLGGEIKKYNTCMKPFLAVVSVFTVAVRLSLNLSKMCLVILKETCLEFPMGLFYDSKRVSFRMKRVIFFST